MSLSTGDECSAHLHIEEAQPESVENLTLDRSIGSDTTSRTTADGITANVESPRSSNAFTQDTDLDVWTSAVPQIEDMVTRTATANDPQEVEDAEVKGEDSSESEDSESEALRGEEEMSLGVGDDGCIRNVVGARRANKWIKGALIGAGSSGKVYLAMDASTGFLMAVKQVELPKVSGPNHEYEILHNTLGREIELIESLKHENIVQYLYSSLEDEFLNIFLEYVPGGSVASLLSKYGAFEESLVKTFARQTLQGLDYLHERDIIHRGIKSANILVNNNGTIKISAFRISKRIHDNLSTASHLNRPSPQGSVSWTALEVAKQTAHTRKADIWSVGCLIVEMLTGEHPKAQLAPLQATSDIDFFKPTIPSGIPVDAQDFLCRTFEEDYEARPSAAELLHHAWIAGAIPK